MDKIEVRLSAAQSTAILATLRVTMDSNVLSNTHSNARSNVPSVAVKRTPDCSSWRGIQSVACTSIHSVACTLSFCLFHKRNEEEEEQGVGRRCGSEAGTRFRRIERVQQARSENANYNRDRVASMKRK